MERDSDQLARARSSAPFGRRAAVGPTGSFEGGETGSVGPFVRVATAEQAMACEAATIAAGTESFTLMRAAGEAAAGLILVDEKGAARYAPATEQLDKLVDKTLALYARSPDKVRRMIISGASPGLSAFADAFKLRKD